MSASHYAPVGALGHAKKSLAHLVLAGGFFVVAGLGEAARELGEEGSRLCVDFVKGCKQHLAWEAPESLAAIRRALDADGDEAPLVPA